MSDEESRTDYGWRSAWGRSSRSSGSAPTPNHGEESSTDPGAEKNGVHPTGAPEAPVSMEPSQLDGPVEPEYSAPPSSPTWAEPVDGPESLPGEVAPADGESLASEPSDLPTLPTLSNLKKHDGPTEEASGSVADPGIDIDLDADFGEPELPPPPPLEPSPAPLKQRPLPRVIALANQKGGVGKTTTTINLGAALAEDDHRTLIIDLDPQGNATTGLGINSRALDYSIYDVLLAEVPLEDCVESTSVRNLFIAPASLDLAGAEIELVPAMSREMRLRNAISRVKDDYDYILIDCPPSLGLLTVNALAAADEVMVPIQCEYYALEGLGQLIRNINLVQKNLNTTLELSSIILVMYDGRTKLAEQVSTEVREHFGNVVCRNVIPRNIRLSEAPSYGQPITTFDPSSRGAVAYRELAREVHRVSS